MIFLKNELWTDTRLYLHECTPISCNVAVTARLPLGVPPPTGLPAAAAAASAARRPPGPPTPAAGTGRPRRLRLWPAPGPGSHCGSSLLHPRQSWPPAWNREAHAVWSWASQLPTFPGGSRRKRNAENIAGKLLDISLGMIFWIWIQKQRQQKQTGGTTKQLLRSKRNQKQNERATYRMGENTCQSYIC